MADALRRSEAKPCSAMLCVAATRLSAIVASYSGVIATRLRGSFGNAACAWIGEGVARGAALREVALVVRLEAEPRLSFSVCLCLCAFACVPLGGAAVDLGGIWCLVDRGSMIGFGEDW